MESLFNAFSFEKQLLKIQWQYMCFFFFFLLSLLFERAKLTYSNIHSVRSVPWLKFSHVFTLTPKPNGVN